MKESITSLDVLLKSVVVKQVVLITKPKLELLNPCKDIFVSSFHKIAKAKRKKIGVIFDWLMSIVKEYDATEQFFIIGSWNNGE